MNIIEAAEKWEMMKEIIIDQENPDIGTMIVGMTTKEMSNLIASNKMGWNFLLESTASLREIEVAEHLIAFLREKIN